MLGVVGVVAVNVVVVVVVVVDDYDSIIVFICILDGECANVRVGANLSSGRDENARN